MTEYSMKALQSAPGHVDLGRIQLGMAKAILSAVSISIAKSKGLQPRLVNLDCCTGTIAVGVDYRKKIAI